MKALPIFWLHLVGTNQVRLTRRSAEWIQNQWQRRYGAEIDFSEVKREESLFVLRDLTVNFVGPLRENNLADPVLFD